MALCAVWWSYVNRKSRATFRTCACCVVKCTCFPFGRWRHVLPKIIKQSHPCISMDLLVMCTKNCQIWSSISWAMSNEKWSTFLRRCIYSVEEGGEGRNPQRASPAKCFILLLLLVNRLDIDRHILLCFCWSARPILLIRMRHCVLWRDAWTDRVNFWLESSLVNMSLPPNGQLLPPLRGIWVKIRLG